MADAPQPRLTQQRIPQAAPVPCIPGNYFELILMALPNGVEGTNARFSVLVSPRLIPPCEASLGQYRPVFTDWPETVRRLTFQMWVEANGRATPLTPEPLWTTGLLDSRLWASIFPPETKIRPYVFDRRQHAQPGRFHPFALPERNLHRLLVKQNLYQTLAVGSPTQRPRATDVLPHLERAGVVSRVQVPTAPGKMQFQVGVDRAAATVLGIRQQLLQREMQLFQKRGLEPGALSIQALKVVPRVRDETSVRAVTGNVLSARQLDFMEFQAFAQRPGPTEPAKPNAMDQEVRDWQRNIDFHQIVASLGDYPEILRRLGLRLDFRVPAASVATAGRVWIRIADAALDAHVLSPATAHTGANGFRAQLASPNSEIRDGFLTLGRTEQVQIAAADGKSQVLTLPVFDVVPGDVEGAVAKITNFAELLIAPAQPGAPTEGQSLPALRSVGLAVAHSKRDSWLEDVLRRAAELNDLLTKARALPPAQRGPAITLQAEHLSRGLRIDVREVRRMPNAPPQFGPWNSLCDRQGRYFVGPNLPPVFEQIEEGWVSLGLTEGDVASTPTTPGQQPSAVKPLLMYESLFRWTGWSLCVPRPGRNVPTGSVALPSTPPAGLRLQTVFAPIPGVLPRLRFGRQYQFRARVVDLAGNSPSVKDVPMLPPELVTSDQDGYYDRFEPVTTPPVVLTRPLTGKPTGQFDHGEPLSPGESVVRLVIRTMNVEQPGELLAGPPTPTTARHLVPPKISQELAEAHSMFDNPQTKLLAGAEAYRLMVAKDRPLSEQETTEDIHPEPQIIAPYLADPMAAGTALLQLPGTDQRTGFLWLQPFEGAWPERRSFRLQIEGGAGPPQFQNGVLRVFLPPGEQRTVQLSAFLPPEAERLFGIWRWITERTRAPMNPPLDLEAMRTIVRQGRHWMITPPGRLVLVHATQQPVLKPLWVFLHAARNIAPNAPQPQLQLQRRYGETIAPLLGTIALHRGSTEKFDLEAEWTEANDRGEMKENPQDWLYVKAAEHVHEQKVAPPPDPLFAQVVARAVPGPEGPLAGAQDGLEEPPLDWDRIPSDSRELAPLPEETLQELDRQSSSGEVQERGVAGLAMKPNIAGQVLVTPKPPAASPAQPPAASPQLKAPPSTQIQPEMRQKLPPSAIAAPGVQAPPPPPPYDETKHRCAPAPPPPPPDYGERLTFEGTHRFHDTKYRCVTYTAIASTRYRDYFRPLPSEDVSTPPRFTRSSPPIKVDVLNSAQPDMPKVLYVIPTFKWERGPQGSRRVGGGLRVYLDRPWFSSGDGEQLAVVIYPDPRADLPDYARNSVSQWGLDPLWESSQTRPGMITPQLLDPKFQRRGLPEESPPATQETPETPGSITERGTGASLFFKEPLSADKLAAIATFFGAGHAHPTPQDFRNAVAVRYDLGLNEVRLFPDGKVGTRGTPLQGAVTNQMANVQQMMRAAVGMSMPVTICAFEVKPDPSRQLWYCDIEMNPGKAYYPFVRLALARYQPNSIPGAHLSRVVLADFAQLIPERAASVAPDPKQAGAVIVSVVGVQGEAYPIRTTIVDASLEEANPNIAGDLGWMSVPNPAVRLGRISDQQQWVGSVQLPPPAQGRQYRIVVKEYETFHVEEADAATRDENRLVYVDVLPVPR